MKKEGEIRWEKDNKKGNRREWRASKVKSNERRGWGFSIREG